MAAGIDLARIRQVHASLEQLRREIGQATPVDLATVGAFLAGSHNGTAVELPATSWPELAAAMALALDGLVGMRVQEGRAISEDLQGRLSTLRSLIDAIAGMAAANPGRANRRLEERLSALSGTMPGLEPTRLAQEAAVLAERLDVSEELARLRAHFDHLAGLLAGDAKDAPGRRMDFLAQEIGRELNTLGGKVQDAAIAALVIDGKSELEKLREQVQNIE
jgi:uncharacterized protein (TIGR00255 family)